MSEKEQSNKTTYKFSDNTIAIIRELLQLSILTGTNIVDHLRAVILEEKDGKILPSEEYVTAYNEMVEQLEKNAIAMASDAVKKEVNEEMSRLATSEPTHVD